MEGWGSVYCSKKSDDFCGSDEVGEPYWHVPLGRKDSKTAAINKVKNLKAEKKERDSVFDIVRESVAEDLNKQEISVLTGISTYWNSELKDIRT
ncbi:hypothetical protein AgCh_011865 [Apium graveolens]